MSLREQDIQILRGDVDKALHRAQSLDARQDDRLAVGQPGIESSSVASAKREKRSAKASAWAGSKSSWSIKMPCSKGAWTGTGRSCLR